LQATLDLAADSVYQKLLILSHICLSPRHLNTVPLSYSGPDINCVVRHTSGVLMPSSKDSTKVCRHWQSTDRQWPDEVGRG